MAQKKQKKQTYGPPAPWEQPTPSNPYYNMFNQAGAPVTLSPDYNNPLASAYPQPQRPDAYSNMNAGRDGRQFSPEMMGDQPIQQPGPYASGYQTDPMQPQGVQSWGEPPMHPDQAAPFNEAWKRNLDKSSKEFADGTWGMMKRGIGNIGGFFADQWKRKAEGGDDVNLTEDLIGKGIPAAASAVYNTGKSVWDQATDPSNMRGPFKEKVMEHYARPGGELRDITQEGLRGMEAPSPGQLPNLEEVSMESANMSDKMFQDWQSASGGKGWNNPTTGMGKSDADTIAARDEDNPNWRQDVARQQGWAKNYLDQQAQPEEVSPIDALGAKMVMGAKGVGDAITGAPGAVAKMGGKGIGSIFGMGRNFLQNIGEGFKEGAAKQRGEVPQAQGTPQAGKREIDVSPLQGMNDPRLEKGAKVSPSQNTASTKGGFKGAFAAARNANQKDFMYKGKKYNTKLKGKTQTAAAKKPTAKQTRKGSYGDYYGTMKKMFGWS